MTHFESHLTYIEAYSAQLETHSAYIDNNSAQLEAYSAQWGAHFALWGHHSAQWGACFASWGHRFAQIQQELGVKGSYYFRAVPESWDDKIIKEISALGHEIGYHYESLTTTNGNIEAGIKDFEKNLNALRKLAPVSTICMHGSPTSKWDSKALWKHYNYKDYEIIAEPYFDNVFYLSDTGRRWNGWKVSVRDKVPQQEQWQKEGLVFHSTNDIIKAVEKGFPKKPALSLSKGTAKPSLKVIMFTFHPQRWTDKPVPWVKELVLQNAKNIIKYFLIKVRT